MMWIRVLSCFGEAQRWGGGGRPVQGKSYALGSAVTMQLNEKDVKRSADWLARAAALPSV